VAELVIDAILRKRAQAALLEAGYSCRQVISIHPPEDTAGRYEERLLEVWFIDGDGTGDWVFMEEYRDGAAIKLKAVPDP